MMGSNSFWEEMARLVRTQRIVIDRPKGRSHPRYPQMIYPLDYGYLEGTSTSDGNGIDVWLGSDQTKMLTGILCTFDTLKMDTEIKILLGCTKEDIQLIDNFYGDGMKTLYISMEPQ